MALSRWPRIGGLRVVMSWPDSQFAPPPSLPGRARIRLAGFAGTALLLGGAAAIGVAVLAQQHAPSPAAAAAGTVGPAAPKQPSLRRSAPVSVAIPAIGVQSPLLRLGLNPPRARLYERINQRAAAMFDRGLIEETERLIARYGADCRPFTSLGYAEAIAVLQNELTREQAVAQAQQGHRNYAKRQITWFRREPGMHWLEGCGGDEDITDRALQLVAKHLKNN